MRGGAVSRTGIYIVGCGGHAKVIAGMIAAGDRFEVSAFVDRAPEPGAQFLGRPIHAEAEFLTRNEKAPVVVAIGEAVYRRATVEKLKAAGFGQFPSILAPSAHLTGEVSIAEGTVVMPGACLNPSADVGAFCIVNTGAVLEHDCRLGDWSALAPGVTVGGGCRIGGQTYIGIGASIAHGVTVGANAVLGGGAFLARDMGDNEFWAGVPAALVRTRQPGETVL